VSQLEKQRICCFCHSGLDPWFHRLTTLSEAEGESVVFSEFCATGYRSRHPGLDPGPAWQTQIKRFMNYATVSQGRGKEFLGILSTPSRCN
jgi:hypothetical protein